MNLLAPAMLFFGLLAIPIFLLYMLKLRRRDMVVSSTFLWAQILKDQHANAPWQRLKYQVLLLVQLLILAALVLTLARPAVPVQTLAAGPTIIILDGSASMNATDVEPSRFEVAKIAVHQVVDGLSANSPVTLILAGNQAQLLTSNETNRGTINQAVDGAHADQGTSDWKGAFSLAAGSGSRKNGGNNEQISTTVIVSDGGLPQEGLPSLAGEIRYIPVGMDGKNMGITALAVRQSPSGLQLFTSVENFGNEPSQVVLSCFGDGQLFLSKQIELGAGKHQDFVFENVPANAKLFNAKLAPFSGNIAKVDEFALDDSASTVYQPSSGGRVLLVTQGNIFLKQLLDSLPGVNSFELLPLADKSIAAPTEAYDVYVLDGIVPQGLPGGNLLMVNPPSNEFFTIGGSFENPSNIQLADSPINRFVDWSNVHVASAKKVTLPSWAQAIIQSKDGPLVFVGETSGRRVAVVTFDLHNSDLPLQISYPVLFSNLMQYLSRSKNLTAINGSGAPLFPGNLDAVKEDNLQIMPGDLIQISLHQDAGKIQVIAPDGSTLAIKTANGRVVFDQTQWVGNYQVVYPDHPEIPADAFAVNLFSAEEEYINPKETLTIGQKTVSAKAELVTGQREYWPWLAGAGLAVLLLEWWMYQRQQGQRLNWERKG